MSLATNEIARRDAESGRTEVRPEPLRLRVRLAGLESSDGHDVNAVFSFGARVAENRSDRELFNETFLSERPGVMRDDLAAHLAKRSRDATAAHVSRAPAADLLSSAGRASMIESFRAAADAAAFACGLALLAPFDVELESASLQRQKLEHMQRAQAEERAAGQVEHLRRAGELLRQFQSIRSSADAIAPGQVLQQIAPGDREATFEALLLASSRHDRPSTLYAVSGPSLVRIERPAVATGGVVNNLPRALGPLRSVQRTMRDGKPFLLVGARDGILAVYPDSFGEPRMYAAPAAQDSQLGFNGVVYDESNDCIYGTHGDRGVVRWSYESREPLPSIAAFEAMQNVRFPVLISPGIVAYVQGDALVFAPPGECIERIEAAGRGAVAGIIGDATRLFVVHRDGAIVTVDRVMRKVVDVQQRAGQIVAAVAIPWLGSIRLLLARDDGPIECIGPDDQLVTQYGSAQRGYKMVAASADAVAAVSSDRQRLILWHAWDGRKPFAEIHLTTQTRHRIADIDFE